MSVSTSLHLRFQLVLDSAGEDSLSSSSDASSSDVALMGVDGGGSCGAADGERERDFEIGRGGEVEDSFNGISSPLTMSFLSFSVIPLISYSASIA